MQRAVIRLLLLTFLAAFGCILGASAAIEDVSRGWRFHLGDAPGAEAAAFKDSAWTVVDAPHPARIEALVTEPQDKQQWEGICWYRKVLTFPAHSRGQVVHLRFEGAMNVAEVFVNGEKKAQSIDGYTPFVVDLTEYAKTADAVVIALRLDNHSTPVTGPKPLAALDFHLYHGLYRNVLLSVQPPLHITDEILENLPASGGVFITYPEVSDTKAVVAVQTHVRNASAAEASFQITATLKSLSGETLATASSGQLTLSAGEARAFPTRLEVNEPKLWSPASPNLHYVDVEVAPKSGPVDQRRERIGIRRIELGPGGLTINGRKQFLRGVNRHQEYPYVGNALPAAAQYRDAVKIKQAGFDYIRLSHYPHSPAFMDACDELGLVTMDSILGWQFNPGTPAFVANRLAAARALIRRDRNHPSAVFWEVSLNETQMKPDFIAALHAAAHEEFPGDQMFTAGWVKGYDVKVTARQHHSTKEFLHATFPCIVSEYGDWEYYAQNAGLAQEKWQNLNKAERSSRQLRGDGEVRLLQQATNLQEAHNENRSTQALADGYWVMFDYNRGYAADVESSGIMDLFRLPKFSYFFFQSQRDAAEKFGKTAGGPMVHIATWWTPASPLSVRVFSNGDEVELFLNGRSLGRRSPDKDRLSDHLAHPPFTFTVEKFEPGELKAVAYLNGKYAAEHTVKSPGEAKRLELVLDTGSRPLAADGDLVFVYARVVDDAGTVAPNSTASVNFQVKGPAELIGQNPIAAEAGIATILLKTRPGAGKIQIEATSGPLKGAISL